MPSEEPNRKSWQKAITFSMTYGPQSKGNLARADKMEPEGPEAAGFSSVYVCEKKNDQNEPIFQTLSKVT